LSSKGDWQEGINKKKIKCALSGKKFDFILSDVTGSV
jgi:hypothetical protein